MSGAIEFCGVKLYVHFTDLFQELVPDIPDDFDGANQWHESHSDFEEALFELEGVNEVCVNHQCWLVVELAATEDLKPHAERLRQGIKDKIQECFL